MLQPSIGRRGSWLHFKENIPSLIVEALLILRYIPSPFSLQHFWIDMKDCIYPPSVSKASEVPIEEESVLSDSKNEVQHIRKDGKKPASKMRKPKIISKESFQEE